MSNAWSEVTKLPRLGEFFRRTGLVFVVLSDARRKAVHFGSAECPTQEWTMQQLREALPWDQAPRSALRDRDAIDGRHFVAMTRDMGIEEVLTAPRSLGKIPLRNGWPYANAWTTSWCGTADRCVELCNGILLTTKVAGRICRLQKMRPLGRPVQPPALGKVIEIPQVGGLHHLCIRKPERSDIRTVLLKLSE